MIPSLFPFQEKSIEWLLKRKRGILAHDTGLGKTRIVLEALKRFKVVDDPHKDFPNQLRVCIACPAYLRSVWLEQIETWIDTDPKAPEINFWILSYEWFTKDKNIKQMLLYNPHVLICDEAHYIRNWTAQRTRNILLKVAPTRRVYLLTATPVVRCASDLHPLVSVVQPGMWGTFQQFCDRYCEREFSAFDPRGYKYVGINRAFSIELKERMKANFLRVKKRDVLKELPEKQVIKRTLSLEHDFPKALKDEAREVINAGKHASSRLAEYRRLLGEVKVEPVFDLVQSFQGEPCVIFAHHRSVVEALSSKLLEIHPDSTASIHGGTPVLEREKIIQRFQNGELASLVVSIGAAGAGITLHRSNLSVMAELPWTYAEIKQAEDRIHRIGQVRGVQSYRMVVEGSIDEMILSSLDQKIEAEELSVGHIE